MFAKNFRAAPSPPPFPPASGFSKQLLLLNRKTDKNKPSEVQGTLSQLVPLVKTMLCAVLIVVHQLCNGGLKS